MVSTHYNHIIGFGSPHCFWRRICTGAFYLHHILVKQPKSQPQKTLAIIIGGFCLWAWGIHSQPLFLAAIGLGAIGFSFKPAAVLIEKLWFALAKVLSYIVPNILLSVIYLLVVTPVAIFIRLFSNKDSMHLKNNAETMWLKNETEINKSYFEKTW